jgi:BirA family transcriptional regulator, biotin operon repressor / biotin---[acetyl-CoA-carboxylase] ligase
MTRPRCEIVHLVTCQSTQDEAWQRVRDGTQIVAVSAESQSAGRGRQDRPWHSPSGNLFLSLGVSIEGKRDKAWPFVSLLAGIAAARSLQHHGAWDEACFLKWPNDLFRRDRTTHAVSKVGGILTELRKEVLLVGVGINVAHAPSLEASTYTSTAVANFAPHPPTASQLAKTLVEELSELVVNWIHDDAKLTADAIAELEGNWMRPFFSMRGHVDGLGEVRAERLLGDGRLEVSALRDPFLKQAVSSGEFRLLT